MIQDYNDMRGRITMAVLFFTGELPVTAEDARDIGTEPVEDPVLIGTILDGRGPEHRPSFLRGKISCERK